MGENSAENIRRSMDEIRSYLAADAGNVAQATRAMTDWRTYVRRYPWICVGGAAVVGYLLVRKRPQVFISHVSPFADGKKSSPVYVDKNRSSMAGSVMVMLSSMVARQAVHAAERYLSQRQQKAKRSESSPHTQSPRSPS